MVLLSCVSGEGLVTVDWVEKIKNPSYQERELNSWHLKELHH